MGRVRRDERSQKRTLKASRSDQVRPVVDRPKPQENRLGGGLLENRVCNQLSATGDKIGSVGLLKDTRTGANAEGLSG